MMAAIAVESALEALSRYNNHKSYEARKLGRIELARQIGLYSYWMSEHPEVMKTMKLLSSHLLNQHDNILEIEKFRDEYNKN